MTERIVDRDDAVDEARARIDGGVGAHQAAFPGLDAAGLHYGDVRRRAWIGACAAEPDRRAQSGEIGIGKRNADFHDVGREHRRHRRARADIIADIGPPLADAPGERRADIGAGKIKLGGTQRSLGGGQRCARLR